MRSESRESLERLCTFCDVCGLFCIGIGMAIVFIDLLERNMLHIQVGIYIFISGYAYVKIARRVANVLIREGLSD